MHFINISSLNFPNSLIVFIDENMEVPRDEVQGHRLASAQGQDLNSECLGPKL